MSKSTLGASAPISEAKLRNVITDIDALSQEGFSNISAIAQLCIESLEASKRCSGTRKIVHALQVIRSIASTTEGGINYNAGTVGCNYKEGGQQ
jgi:hypothetical protein